MKKITGYAREHRKNPTPAEKKLKELLLKWKISFRSQRQFDYFIVDFLFPKKRLVVELDGSSHNNKEIYDNRRTYYLEKLGLAILRFENSIVFNNPQVIREEIIRHPDIDLTELSIRDIYGKSKY